MATANDPVAFFNNFVTEAMKILHDTLIETLSYLGNQCVKRIRQRGSEESWIDQTGNLRTSIGFAVIDKGKTTVESAFEQVKQGTEGQGASKKYIESVQAKYNDTYALLVVAGMDYAAAVEARDNKDVLASTELWARGVIDDYMQRGVELAQKRIQKLMG